MSSRRPRRGKVLRQAGLPGVREHENISTTPTTPSPIGLVGPISPVTGQPSPISTRSKKEEGTARQEYRRPRRIPGLFGSESIALPTIETRISARNRLQMAVISERREEELQKLQVESIIYTFYSDDDLRKEAVVTIDNPKISSDPKDNIGTVMDPRMGVLGENQRCSTCKKDNLNCPGHFGVIELARPIYQYPFIKQIIKVLQSICNYCGGLLISEEIIKSHNLLQLKGSDRLTAISERAKKIPCSSGGCPPNPVYAVKRSEDTYEIYIEIKTEDKEKKEEIPKPIEDVKEILRCITQDTAELLGFSNGSHPASLIHDVFPVLPPCDRPHLYQGGEERLDRLTDSYIEVIVENERLKNATSDKVRQKAYRDLFFKIRHIIDNSDNQYGQSRNGQPMKCIKRRIQGKRELIRGAMMGARVDFSARSVVGPDPSLRFGQVRIPKGWASRLTVPVRVVPSNLNYIRELGRQGKISYLIQDQRSSVGGIRKAFKPEMADRIQIGHTVERHLMNGDIVLVNRQPTLHKYGMMGMEVVLGDTRSIGLHPVCTSPFNAD